MSTPSIEVKSLIKEHGSQRILDGISMSVNTGEVAVLVGPSGGGKSTLLRCINALEVFQGGSIRVGPTTLEADPNRPVTSRDLVPLRQHVGMVFQQFNLFPHMSVLDNVLIGPMRVQKQPRDVALPRALELLRRVGLESKRDARPAQLSGGQQQRVAIARALAVHPSAILFDEPTSALDPKMASEVLNVITDLAREGQTMIVVTHAMEFARRVAHTVHVMHAGRIAESGPPAQIFEAPVEEVTQNFVRDSHRNA